MQTKLLCLTICLFFTLSIHAQVLFYEDFETADGTNPPTGWTQETFSGTAEDIWRFDDPNGINDNDFHYPELQGQFAIFDNWFYQQNTPSELDKDAVLVSPELDFSEETDYIFVYFTNYFWYGLDTKMSAEVFNGTEWIEVYERKNGDLKVSFIQFEITEQAKGVSNARIRFRFQDAQNSYGYWAIDHLEIVRRKGFDLEVVGTQAYNALECWSQEVSLSVTLRNTGYIPIDFAEHPLQLKATIRNKEVEELLYENTVTMGSLAIGEEKEFTITSNAQFPEFEKTFYIIETAIEGEFNPKNDRGGEQVDRWGPNHSPTRTIFGKPNSNNSTNSTSDFHWRPAIGTPNNLAIDPDNENGWKQVSHFVNNPNHEYKTGAMLRMGEVSVDAWYVSRPIFVTEVSHLIFETAMTQAGSMESATWGSDDFLAVLVSTDCGASFEEIRRFDQNTPIDNQARKKIIQLRDYADQEIQVGLYASNGTEQVGTEVELFLANLYFQEVPVWDTAFGEVDAEAIYCNESGGNLWVEVLNSGSSSLPFVLNPLELNLKVFYGSNKQYFNTVIDEGILSANGSTWVGIPLIDLQPFTSHECLVELSMSLTEEQNESNNFQKWTEPLRNPFLGHVLSVDFQGHYNHLPLGNTFPGWWEGVGEEKPTESNSKWETNNTGGGLISVHFDEGENIEEWVVSPVFVPENNTELRFNFSINSWPNRNFGNDDVFKILISTDCLNFEPLMVYDSTHVHPFSKLEDVYDLSAYEGQEVMIAFHGSSNGVADKYAILVLYDVYIGPALETNISESSLEEEDFLRVFPNPSKGVFFLDWGDNRRIEEDGEVMVTNAVGQVLYRAALSSLLTNSGNGNQAVIDASDWEEGVYLLLWRYGNQSHSQKLVKMGG
ncbi:MAG: T9SS type A sorting domain-containing protein [Chitinophagales bacterium]